MSAVWSMSFVYPRRLVAGPSRLVKVEYFLSLIHAVLSFFENPLCTSSPSISLSYAVTPCSPHIPPNTLPSLATNTSGLPLSTTLGPQARLQRRPLDNQQIQAIVEIEQRNQTNTNGTSTTQPAHLNRKGDEHSCYCRHRKP